MVIGQNGVIGMIAANLVAMDCILEPDNVYHPNMEVPIVPAVLPKLLNAILILVPVSYNDINFIELRLLL